MLRVDVRAAFLTMFAVFCSCIMFCMQLRSYHNFRFRFENTNLVHSTIEHVVWIASKVPAMYGTDACRMALQM